MTKTRYYRTKDLSLTIHPSGNPTLHLRVVNKDWDQWEFVKLSRHDGAKMLNQIRNTCGKEFSPAN